MDEDEDENGRPEHRVWEASEDEGQDYLSEDSDLGSEGWESIEDDEDGYPIVLRRHKQSGPTDPAEKAEREEQRFQQLVDAKRANRKLRNTQKRRFNIIMERGV